MCHTASYGFNLLYHDLHVKWTRYLVPPHRVPPGSCDSQGGPEGGSSSSCDEEALPRALGRSTASGCRLMSSHDDLSILGSFPGPPIRGWSSPESIPESCPEANGGCENSPVAIVTMLRDPVERVISAYEVGHAAGSKSSSSSCMHCRGSVDLHRGAKREAKSIPLSSASFRGIKT